MVIIRPKKNIDYLTFLIDISALLPILTAYNFNFFAKNNFIGSIWFVKLEQFDPKNPTPIC